MVSFEKSDEDGENMDKKTVVQFWKQALKFYGSSFSRFLLFPLIGLPLFGKIFAAVYIKQEEQPSAALNGIGQSFRLLPSYIPSAFGIEWRNYVYILLHGRRRLRNIGRRLAKKLSVSVLVFESLKGEEAFERCLELFDSAPESLVSRTIFLVPLLIGGLSLLVSTILSDRLESSQPFWLFFAVTYLVFFPLLNVVKVFLYLDLAKIAKNQAEVP